MRVLLQINVVVNSGSTGRIAEDIGQMVLQKGWKSYIAYGRNERPSKSELIRIGTKWDMVSHGLQTRLLDRQGLASCRATRELLERIDRIKPDIVHLHVIHGYYLNYRILFQYLRQKNIPVVWTLHDCWSFTGHCAYYSAVQCSKWQKGCRNCPQIQSYPKSLFIDRSRKNWNEKRYIFSSLKNLTLVPVSEWLASEICKSFLDSEEIKCINNGIDTEIFTIRISSIKEKLKIDGKMMVLGVANVWDKRKGLEDFYRLSELLPPDHSIVLVGLSRRQMRDLPAKIIGVMRTENITELAEFYSAADVFVNPTWEDNYPTTNMEALACGVPVITYNTGGSVEVITPQTGYVVEQGDVRGLAEKIARIKQKGKIFYQDECRKYALDHFRKEDKYEDYFQLYEQILSVGN